MSAIGIWVAAWSSNGASCNVAVKVWAPQSEVQALQVLRQVTSSLLCLSFLTWKMGRRLALAAQSGEDGMMRVRDLVHVNDIILNAAPRPPARPGNVGLLRAEASGSREDGLCCQRRRERLRMALNVFRLCTHFNQPSAPPAARKRGPKRLKADFSQEGVVTGRLDGPLVPEHLWQGWSVFKESRSLPRPE